jgi:hypothetical protein
LAMLFLSFFFCFPVALINSDTNCKASATNIARLLILRVYFYLFDRSHLIISKWWEA